MNNLEAAATIAAQNEIIAELTQENRNINQHTASCSVELFNMTQRVEAAEWVIAGMRMALVVIAEHDEASPIIVSFARAALAIAEGREKG